MTRIYFKPQGCCVRNPRSSRSAKLAPAERMKKSEQGSNWRKQLDPEAIEQIADGLEKMVLSWTSSPAVHVHERLPTPTDVDPGTLFLPPMDQLEEMMRGELINTCRPSITSGENALAGQQSAEASFWYLTPAKSQPKCLMREGQVQDTDGGSLAPSDTHIFQEMGSRSIIKAQSRWPHKWPRIQSMDNSESGSDTDAKEASSCQQIDNSLPETVSYHIKATASSEWNGSTEITAGNQVTELLGKQCMLPGNASPYTQLLETEESVDVYKKKVEELQIALLECAMEYEVKIVEMKMQMLHFKSEQRQKDGDGSCSKPGSHKLNALTTRTSSALSNK